jgi:hypothetical protein
MRIRDRHPALQVLLKKNVSRMAVAGGIPVSTRFANTQNRTIDLAPFLGDGGGVRVSKSTRQAAGVFSVELTDQIRIDDQDSLYGLIEPMDVIEIRMTGEAFNYQYDQFISTATGTTTSQAPFPITMRGFVGEVRRTQSMGANGQPQRKVIVTGHDYGKIWQIYQIFYMPNLGPQTANAITQFAFYSRFGVTFNIENYAQFLQEVVDRILNPFIREMEDIGSQADRSPLLEFKTSIQDTGAKVSPYGIGGWSGSIYGLLSQFGDLEAWNELFIEDREDAPYVIYRPNPFKTADGKSFIQTIKPALQPNVIDITLDADVVSYEVGRSDQDVANYFWVDAPRFNISYTEAIQAFAFYGHPDTFFVQNYGNVDPRLYGIRKMQVATDQGDEEETDQGNGTPKGAQRDSNSDALLSFMSKRRLQLIAQNKDNVVFEQGTFRLKGNEKIKAGVYLRLTHGNMQSLYYVVAVHHEYRPFNSYMTTAQVERGTGFIDRSQQESGAASPYWGEIAQSPG